MADTSPDYSNCVNRGLHLLIEVIDKTYGETQEAYQSRNGNDIHVEDIRRCMEYMDDIDNWIDFWAKRGLLDLNHTANTVYQLPEIEMPNREMAQNVFWYEHLMAMWELRENIRKSQSRNQAQGFHANDIKRWKEYTQDRRTYFEDFVSKVLPVDYPQTTSPEALYVADRTDYSPGPTGVSTTK